MLLLAMICLLAQCVASQPLADARGSETPTEPRPSGSGLPVVEVEHDQVTAAELAPLMSEWRRLPAATAVLHTPLPGLTRRVGREELARLAVRHGLGAVESAAWPAAIEVRRRMRLLEAAEASSALAVAVARRYRMAPEDVGVELVRFVAPPVPAGELEFRTYGALPRPRDVASVPLTWITAEWRSGTVWLRARVTVRGPYAVAGRALAAREQLTAADVRFEEGELDGAPQQWRLAPADLLGKRLARPVAAGQKIPRSWLITAPTIERGAAVDLELRQGGIELRASGRAERAGSVGERLPFRNLQSGRRVTATLLDRTRAEVAP